MTLNGYSIFKEKLTGGLKNDIRNLVNFHASSCTVQFDGLFLSETFRRVMSYDTEE